MAAVAAATAVQTGQPVQPVVGGGGQQAVSSGKPISSAITAIKSAGNPEVDETLSKSRVAYITVSGLYAAALFTAFVLGLAGLISATIFMGVFLLGAVALLGIICLIYLISQCRNGEKTYPSQLPPPKPQPQEPVKIIVDIGVDDNR